MNIKIDKLILQNFKGIRNLEINADGKDLNIYGDNATGKTTVFDAFMWLLFNKDSLGRTDFGIKTQDSEGNTLHNLEHSVECVLNVDDAILTLKKVYAEKWTKKRGSAEAEFSGHETKYYINEVPSTKSEYTAKISSIIDEELFKTITNPLYFNEHLKWQDRRAILLNICGDISDTDIIASSSEFSPLLNELKGRTIQEYQKIISNKQKGINDDLKTIPQRIAEANLAIPVTVSTLGESDKGVIENKIAELETEKTAIKNGAGLTDINLKIQQFKNDKKALEMSTLDVSAIEQQQNLVLMKRAAAEQEIKENERLIESSRFIISDYEKQQASLREKWHEINDRKFTDSGICPTCGQVLPAEQIEAAKVKFNTDRAEQLENISELGKQKKAVIDKHKQHIEEYTSKINKIQSVIDNEFTPSINRYNEEIETKKAEFKVDKENAISAIDLQIAEAEKKAQNGAQNIQERIDFIDDEIRIERAKIAVIDKAIAERELSERQIKRIAELEADEKRLAKEYAELEKTSFLIDEFIKFKIKLLSDKINELFTYAKFKLFDMQINGGVAECCEVTYQGVPYSDLNNASKLNIGLDIINTLCKVHDKTAPIIVDNAESVVALADTDSQKICLYVNGQDKSLRIEKVN